MSLTRPMLFITNMRADTAPPVKAMTREVRAVALDQPWNNQPVRFQKLDTPRDLQAIHQEVIILRPILQAQPRTCNRNTLARRSLTLEAVHRPLILTAGSLIAQTTRTNRNKNTNKRWQMSWKSTPRIIPALLILLIARGRESEAM
jgi:hypothetical protein